MPLGTHSASTRAKKDHSFAPRFAQGSTTLLQGSQKRLHFASRFPQGSTRDQRFPQLCSKVAPRPRFPQLCSKVSTRFPQLCPSRLFQGSTRDQKSPPPCSKVAPRFHSFAALLQGSHKVPTTLLQGSQKLPTILSTLLQGSYKVPTTFCKARFPQLCSTRLPTCPQHRSTTLPHKVLPRFPQLCFKVPTRFPQGLAQVSCKVPATFPIDSQGNVIIPQVYFIALPAVAFHLANLLVSYAAVGENGLWWQSELKEASYSFTVPRRSANHFP